MTIPASSPKHAPHMHQDGTTCEQCLVPLPTNRSAKIAWTVAGIAVALLLIVFFMGATSAGGTFLAGAGGLTLLALLACPLTMGAMMWMMIRKKH